MKNYTDFEVIETIKPFRLRQPQTPDFGWFWLTKSIASIKATGGNWFQFSFFLTFQIILFCIAFIADSFLYVSVHFFKAITAVLVYLLTKLYEVVLIGALKPLLWLFAICFAVLLIYALYKVGLWSQLLNYLLNFLQQWHF